MSKLKVGIVFGGKSVEHEVSLQSAKNIVDAIDKNKYEVVLIGIDKQGKWYVNDVSSYLINAEDPKLIQLSKSDVPVAFVPGQTTDQLINASSAQILEQLDVIFPIVHGTLGEDGSIQGLLRIANLPFVGPSVLSSAVCMDKDIAKQLLHLAGINVAKSMTFTRGEQSEINYNDALAYLKAPMFIKPANQGSSVGISKVSTEQEFTEAIELAFQYDHKLIIEETIIGREIECSVLGNEQPEASLPGEILPQTEYYSYESKYIDAEGAKLKAPASLSADMTKKVQAVSIQAFKALQCEGLARVDFFLTKDDQLYVNELNTLPGFTEISMYPKLWEVSGLAYTDLITRLIELAIERHKDDVMLKSSVWAE